MAKHWHINIHTVSVLTFRAFHVLTCTVHGTQPLPASRQEFTIAKEVSHVHYSQITFSNHTNSDHTVSSHFSPGHIQLTTAQVTNSVHNSSRHI